MFSYPKTRRLPTLFWPVSWARPDYLLLVSCWSGVLFWLRSTKPATDITIAVSLILFTSCYQGLLHLLNNTHSKSATSQTLAYPSLHSLGYYSAAILHNIAGPLSTASALAATTSPNSPCQRELQACLRHVGRVVRQARINLHPGKYEIQPIRINKVLTELQPIVSTHCQLQGTAFNICCPSNVWVYSNEALLSQVLLNFLTNAIEATKEKCGGRVCIRVYLQDNRAIIKIKDNGQGMTPEQLGTLGRPFITTKANGSGIGVAFALETIKRDIRGSCRFASQPNKGTIVKLSLPLVKSNPLTYNESA